MGIKSFLSQPFAALVVSRHRKWALNAGSSQYQTFKKLISEGRKTAFGKDHHFSEIRSYEDFRKRVPIRDYEELAPYLERVKKNEPDVLWPGKPLYLSKTSGTTSGIKYIPITKASIPFHIQGARDALLHYIHQTGKSDFVERKMIFLSGSPQLDAVNGVPTGRLSGIVNHWVPGYLRKNQLPGYATNCIEDWEEKVEKIADETQHADMSLISGIPPWVQMYFNVLQKRTGKHISELFPNFSLFVYGGVNYEPYRQQMEESIGRKVDSIELYPASEGFIAFQDRQPSEGLLLLTNAGIFYEFVPADEYFNPQPKRLTLDQVELGINYAIILSTNAGLWGYSIGDTVKFVSLKPPRIVVSGRIKHFLSAFGEHVIGEEVEKAILKTISEMPASITEYTVAPQVAPAAGLPHHEWLIEFDTSPKDLSKFSALLDQEIQKLNIYYKDLIEGKILEPLHISCIRKGGFISFMKEKGKLGGQNKVPRLSNDREIANELNKYKDQ